MGLHYLNLKHLSIIPFILALTACWLDDDSNDGGVPANSTPIANAGMEQSVNEQTVVLLAGTGTDSDGTISTFSWSQPAGTSVSLNNTDSNSADFTAPDVTSDEILSFSFTVTNNRGASHTNSVDVEVLKVNIVPISRCGRRSKCGRG